MKGPDRFEVAERWATYIVFSALLIAELLATFVQPIDDALNGRGELVLLAAGILLVFRRIDTHVSALAPTLSTERFGDAVRFVTASGSEPTTIRILANDGTRYYPFVADSGTAMGHLKVLLVDDRAAYKWSRLVEDGKASSVEVRRCSVAAVAHYAISDSGCAMFGLFTRRTADRSTPEHVFTVAADAAPGRVLIDALSSHFDAEWRLASPPGGVA